MSEPNTTRGRGPVELGEIDWPTIEQQVARARAERGAPLDVYLHSAVRSIAWAITSMGALEHPGRGPERTPCGRAPA